MGRLFGRLKQIFKGREEEDSGEETTDIDAVGLSHVGQAYIYIRMKFYAPSMKIAIMTLGM